MSQILSTLKAIRCYSIVEDIIIRHLIHNRDDDFLRVVSNLKYEIENTEKYFNVKVECDSNTQEMWMDAKLFYNNAIVYMCCDFIKDDTFGYLHDTSLICITDSNGVVKQDLTTKLKKGR